MWCRSERQNGDERRAARVESPPFRPAAHELVGRRAEGGGRFFGQVSVKSVRINEVTYRRRVANEESKWAAGWRQTLSRLSALRLANESGAGPASKSVNVKGQSRVENLRGVRSIVSKNLWWSGFLSGLTSRELRKS